jgi:alpha-galactosidase
MKRILMAGVYLFCLLAGPAWAAPVQETKLSFREGEVLADNGLISRRWKIVNGLPVPQSLKAQGYEWLRTDNKPGIVPPDGAPKPPLKIEWNDDATPADPVEAPSRRAALTVLGSDGRGYRWHLQLFSDCPAITCRLEMLGEEHRTSNAEHPTSNTLKVIDKPDNSGIEKDGGPKKSESADADLMERLPLSAFHTEISVADLMDRTDGHDNLAAERTWRMGPKETIKASTCLVMLKDPLADVGLLLLKHAPLPDVRPVKSSEDVIASDRLLRFRGHGAGVEGQGYAWSVIAWKGDRWERTAALHKLQACLRPYRAGRDGLLASNTWGDRNRDARINETFVRAEIAAGVALGVDVCQVDDGWQKGITANSSQAAKGGVWNGFWAADPQFWTPHPQRFPNGLESTIAEAKAKGMAFGLWFAPDSSNDFANWEKDAAVMIDFYQRYGIRNIKIDGVKAHTKAAEIKLQKLLQRIRMETQGELAIDLDVTAEVRPGYFGAIQVGPLYLENRYTDWRAWFPHATLRNLWQLAWYVPPQRLRMEFLNPLRNQAKYGDDPLAPKHYPMDYPFATTLVANPLAFFEVSNLPVEKAKPIADLAQVWRKHREELHTGIVLPIGDCPSGASWTGFCSRHDGAAQILVFRERTREATVQLALPLPSGEWKVERLAGSGEAIWRDGRLHVAIPEQLNYLWVRLTK